MPLLHTTISRLFLPVLLLVPLLALADDAPGHSAHGSAFDSGMRTRPWVMQGIGDTPFPITAKNPEVQKWFDQGNALLHSFWFEEAERSFRWCLKLDPDNAMAYWSLARCGFNWFTIGSKDYDDKQFDRYKAFLSEAVRRKSKVSEREKMYIEAWEHAYAPLEKNRTKTICNALQQIVIRFPDDVEAKCLLSLFNIGQGSAYANELLIQQVLARNAMHPAVCSTSPEKLKQSKMLDHANIKFMSDSAHENARRFSSYDDFEDIQLHSTIIIDKAGQVRWNRTGGDPFTNIDFMLGELKRIN